MEIGDRLRSRSGECQIRPVPAACVVGLRDVREARQSASSDHEGRSCRFVSVTVTSSASSNPTSTIGASAEHVLDQRRCIAFGEGHREVESGLAPLRSTSGSSSTQVTVTDTVARRAARSEGVGEGVRATCPAGCCSSSAFGLVGQAGGAAPPVITTVPLAGCVTEAIELRAAVDVGVVGEHRRPRSPARPPPPSPRR